MAQANGTGNNDVRLEITEQGAKKQQAANAANGDGQSPAEAVASQGDSGTTAPLPEGAPKEEVDFAKISNKEAMQLLRATHEGLTSAEAEKRLAEFGPNKLPESNINPFMRYLGYLWNPLSWAMEVAAILAIILLDYADFALIVALLLLNATISFVEESNADKAIKALTAALAPKSKALRDGTVSTIEAIGLVPGDIIIVRLGDIVPADIKLLGDEGDTEEAPMQIDQAALTGESLPAKKFTGDVAFSGSTIKQGEKHAVVYATGTNTFFGRAAALIGQTNNVANIQKIMTRIGACCLITILVWGLIEVLVQFIHYGHRCEIGTADDCPTLTNLLVIIVGGIPIAMPTVLSVTLALGAYQLAKEGAIVARMSAVEEMAGMDILCSDKTGTLTLNKLSVDNADVFPVAAKNLDELLMMAALSANIVTEEPIDMVLYNSCPAAANGGLAKRYKLIKFIPFNPTDKYTVAHIRDEETGDTFRLMKGAPQVVLKRAHDKEAIHQTVEDKIIDYANRGYRAIGLGRAQGSDGPVDSARWEFLGLVPLFDPPRHDTKATIERCLEKGISVKMVTGDQQLIGKETARQLGMGTNIYKIEALLHSKRGGAVDGHSDIGALVEQADGFAEVYPEHKYEIVEILQKRNHLVGMTGDGVNDAPALKKADVGIAVDGATDAARGAADIVLTKPGLSVIVSAVIGSRKIFQRMTTYAKYTVAMTFRVCFTFGLLTVIYNWYFPTILIVLLAVFNDGAMIALSKDRVVPSPTPNSWRLRNIFIAGIVYGLYLTLSSWALYYVAAKTTFFENHVNMFSLNDQPGNIEPFCNSIIIGNYGLSPAASACTVPAYASQGPCAAGGAGLPSVLSQCVTEQTWLRGNMLRTLIYMQVSFSGQALVFVTRTMGHSLLERAGGYTYLAFGLAQLAASLIAALGFANYPSPPQHLTNGQFTALSNGMDHPFMGARTVPISGTEGVYVASVLGCLYYVIVAWIWACIWYILLDPIKWGLAWVLNEEGVRSRHAWATFLRQRGHHRQDAANEMPSHPGVAPAGYINPMGRASMSAPPPPEVMQRASVMQVEPHTDGMRRVSAGQAPMPMARTSLGRTSLGEGSRGLKRQSLVG